MYRLPSACIRILNSINRNSLKDATVIPTLCASCISRKTSTTSSYSFQTDQQLLSSKIYLASTIQVRGKKNWRGSDKSKSAEYESDSDSDDEFIEKEKARAGGAQVVQVQIDNLRVDAVIKHAFGTARNKCEVLFYENRIRINGKKPLKKSTDTDVGDEVDIIKGLSEDNPNFIVVSRVEILRVRPSGDYLAMTMRKYKSLTIENYKHDSWKEKTSEESEEEQNKEKELA